MTRGNTAHGILQSSFVEKNIFLETLSKQFIDCQGNIDIWNLNLFPLSIWLFLLQYYTVLNTVSIFPYLFIYLILYCCTILYLCSNTEVENVAPPILFTFLNILLSVGISMAVPHKLYNWYFHFQFDGDYIESVDHI